MAETIVKLVLEKVADPVVKEVLHLCGVEKQVEKVQRELNWIRAFLKDADMKHIQEERQKQWVREVRDVAYWIEDVIDTFLCEVPQRKPGKREAVKRWFEKTTKLPVIHKLGEEINQILVRLKEISENKEKYGIHSLGEGTRGVKKLPLMSPVLPDIEDPDVVGFDEDRDNIIKQLLDETNPRRRVVSIVGPGGLGKTTLAKKVYNSHEIQRAYDIRIWITISQEFKLIDVLKRIIEKLRKIDESEEGKDEEYFLTELHKSLKKKKYLLTIDDVWSTNLWMAIEKVLPNDTNGSRIFMTTRKFEVAKDADSEHEPYKLDFLTEQSSQELFLKKAVPNRELQDSYPNDLFDLTQQFVKKCDGLPLALVVLGGLLSKKEATHYVWNRVMQTMNWHTDEQKVCTEIMATSFDDLPLALKSCFMYFAAFPEDHNIYAQDLLQMWIAEGFIPHEENITLEDTAQSFLEDLAKRSMVQVSHRSLDDGSIKMCRIHDLMRDVAIQKAKEDNFMAVCLNQDEVQGCRGARRVAIHNSNDNELMKCESSNLRTLLCFESNISNYTDKRLLKVLHGGNYFDEGEMGNLVGRLSQLRYLHLSSGTSVLWNKKYLEKLIGNLKFLQSISLVDLDDLDHIPDCIWHVKTLRHVDLPHKFYALGPPPSSDLRNLQTLRAIKTRESWKPATLPNMSNVRSLHIEITEGFPLETFIAFLRTLEKLDHLWIKGIEIPIEVVDMRGFPFYQYLIFLGYEGRFSYHDKKIEFETTMFPPHITRLVLRNCELQRDSLVALEKLRGLKWVSLFDAYRDQTMRCSAGGFPCLQVLHVWKSKELEEWEIEEGTMPMLKKLYISYCPMLQIPHGLQHLTALRHLSWIGLEGESGVAKAKEVRDICKHVPSFELQDDNFNFV